MQTLIEQWAGEALVTTFDQPTGTWVFIAIHDTTLGPAMGGCRIKHYPTPQDGLRDAMRLAEGMTHKFAAIGFDLGGGKSVLAVPQPLTGDDRRGLLQRFGALIASLRGLYACGPDLGSTPDDMAVIGEATEHVHGYDRKTGRLLDPGPYTALGVYSGIRAAFRHVFGSDGMQGRTILVQGVGDVGEPLVRMLVEAGAAVLLADADASKVTRLADALGVEHIDNDAVYDTPCDVYAPCAVGATLNGQTIPRLACRIVAGSANNQLGADADAERLHERGILYAPDYVINAGGATALPLLGTGHDPETIRQRIRGFEQTLSEIFDEAQTRNESPFHAARRRVERVLSAKRSERGSALQ